MSLVERFRRREVAPEGKMLRDRIADWLEPQLEELAAARPQLPDELDDRQQDCWEPLFALAEFIGDACLVRARAAALALDAVRDDNSAGVRLLGDIAAIFGASGTDRISSAELATKLHEIEESSWAEWHGRPISTHGIAKLLAHHEIRPRTIRLADGKTPKGYLREQFSEAWLRYLGETNRDNATTGSESEIGADSAPPHVAVENALKPARIEGCGDVAVTFPGKPTHGENGSLPLPGDQGFLETLDEALERGLITARERRERRLHHLVVVRAREREGENGEEVERLAEVYRTTIAEEEF